MFIEYFMFDITFCILSWHSLEVAAFGRWPAVVALRPPPSRAPSRAGVSRWAGSLG